MTKLQSFFLLLLLLSAFAPLKADYITWQGTTNSQWHLPANWSPAVVPGSADIVVIGATAISPTLSTQTVIDGIRVEGGVFTIATGAVLTIRGLGEIYSGAIINNGFLRHESSVDSPPSTNFNIYDSGKLVNNGLSIFRHDSNLLLRDNFPTETVVNALGGVIEFYGNDTGFNILYDGTRSIVNRGTVLYRGSGHVLRFDGTTNTSFTNSGRIMAAGLGIVNFSGSQITNESCGVIDLRGVANYSNASGITNNAGLILMDGALGNSSTFLNTGVVRASSFSPFTNQGLQINNDPNSPIFVYGSPNSYTVSGIYKDSSSVNTAGTFTPPNSFIPNSTQTLLYANVGNGTCEFYVPFLLDPTSLPVTLVSFGLSREGQNANLFWSTTSESNSSHFEIQHSTDAEIWKNIGKILSHGESSMPQSYSYTHADMRSGNNYYRLKMMDLDGSFAYSRIISAENGNVLQIAGSFYPNPAKGSATVGLHLYRIGVWTITSTDLTGRILYSDTRTLSGGLNKVSIPQTGSGLRIVKLTDGRETVFRKLVNE